MWKAILAGTTAMTIVGASLVYAQPTSPNASGANNAPRFRLTPEDRAALADARIAGLKAGLKLTPAQEKNWPAVEAALRDREKLRAERFERFRARREQMQQNPAQRTDMLERLRDRADNMASSAASLKKVTEAIDPLYKSLDDSQKQRFALLFRAGGGRHMWFRGGPGPDQQMGPPPQGPGRPGNTGPRQRRTENEL